MFNQHGYITPSEPILIEIQQFEATFVFNEQRASLFEAYRLYTQELKTVLGTDFHQWINDSFATNKANPKDIDLVNFIDYQIVEKYEKEIMELKKKYYPNIDVYTVKIYPETHLFMIRYQTDCLYWLDLFSKTKPNRKGNIISKGFIQININIHTN